MPEKHRVKDYRGRIRGREDGQELSAWSRESPVKAEGLIAVC